MRRQKKTLYRKLNVTFLLIILKNIYFFSRISITILCTVSVLRLLIVLRRLLPGIAVILVFSFFRKADLNNLFLSCPMPLDFYSLLSPLQALPVWCFQGQQSLGFCSEMNHERDCKLLGLVLITLDNWL